MNISTKNTPVLIFGLTILILILLSLLPPKTKILGIPIKPVDLFMDVKPDSLLNYSEPANTAIPPQFFNG